MSAAGSPQRTALLVCSFDSQLKWVHSIGQKLSEQGFQCRYIVVADKRSALSKQQLSDNGIDEVETLTVDQIVIAGTSSDVVVLGVTGGAMAEIFAKTQTRVTSTSAHPPVFVVGWVGIITHSIVSGYLDRAAGDVIAVNAGSDLRTFEQIAHSLDLPTTGLVLSGLPILPATASPLRRSPIKTVLFADQPTIPKSASDRRYVYERLADYAVRHPDRKVILKPRHRPGEDTLHQMKVHPEEILKTIPHPDNLVVDYTPIVEILPTIDLLLTISSTAGLESIGYGVRTAFITDLGVREVHGNHAFLGSGLMRTFDQVIDDNLTDPSPEWLKDNFFADGSDPAERIVVAINKALQLPVDQRPFSKAMATDYFVSQVAVAQRRDGEAASSSQQKVRAQASKSTTKRKSIKDVLPQSLKDRAKRFLRKN